MKIKNKTRLLKELEKSVDNPWEFIEAVVALSRMSLPEAMQMCNMSISGYYVSKNTGIMGMQVGLKFSLGFGIDPNILNHVIADYTLKKLLEKQTANEPDHDAPAGSEI